MTDLSRFLLRIGQRGAIGVFLWATDSVINMRVPSVLHPGHDRSNTGLYYPFNMTWVEERLS